MDNVWRCGDACFKNPESMKKNKFADNTNSIVTGNEIRCSGGIIISLMALS
jgi:hypothetical protein